MVKIRLKRMGSKLNAFYRIVVSDSRVARNGKSIEQIGFYNPHSKEIMLEEELKNKWLENGAKPTITVKKLFKRYETAKKIGNLKNDLVILKSKIRKKKNKESISKEEK